jgi:ankyrin repeat protein
VVSPNLGLMSLQVALQDPFHLVTYLIREAQFRPRRMLSREKRFSLNICPLGELVDRYHVHEATKLHDKIYALLNMSSDDLSATHLEPDYSVTWKTLKRRLVDFLFSNQALVYIGGDTETAAIRSKGCILGMVTRTRDDDLGRRHYVDAIVHHAPTQEKSLKLEGFTWTLQSAAKSVQKGDLICLLRGAPRPVIIRAYSSHFEIILIAANLPEELQTSIALSIDESKGHFRWREHSKSLLNHDFLLMWDWESSSEDDLGLRGYDSLIREPPGRVLELRKSRMRIIWTLGLLWGDAFRFDEAAKRIQEAMEELIRVLDGEYRHTPQGQYGLALDSQVARLGDNELTSKLLERYFIHLDWRNAEGATPLTWVARVGNDLTVKLLLATKKVDVNSQDRYGRVPLSYAAEKGHRQVVELLLTTVDVHVDSIDGRGQTPLSFAAERGHKDIVELLLATGNASPDFVGPYSTTPLSYAALNGRRDVVELLLSTGNVQVDSRDGAGQTPLSFAAGSGYKDIVELLLVAGNAMVDLEDSSGRTALWYAAQNGHRDVVKLLLTTGNANFNSQKKEGRYLLSLAAKHVGIVELLHAANNSHGGLTSSTVQAPG